MIDLALLGCGGGMPMPNRFLSSLLINYNGRKILVDCGEGTQVSMKMVGWGFKTIDIICITHWHGDHIIGLSGLLSTIANSGKFNPLIIIGPKGIGDIINGLRVIVPYLPYEIKIIEEPKDINFKISKEEIIITEEKGQLNIKTMELLHSINCIGYSFYFNRSPKFNVEKALSNNVPKILWSKLQEGNTMEYEKITYSPEMVLGDNREGIKISYITDTRPIEAIIPFVENSDLFICEGNYGNDEDIEKAIKNNHMTFREAAKLARKGKVKELLITHFSPSMNNPEEYINNAVEEFENVIIGNDRFVKNLTFKNE